MTTCSRTCWSAPPSAAAPRERASEARAVEVLELTGPAAQGEPCSPAADAARAQAAGDGARAGHATEAAAARRDRRRPDRARMRRAGRRDPARSAPSGISIIWIEHVVHALLAVVDRLARDRFRQEDRRRRSATRSWPARRSREIYMGIEATAMAETLLDDPRPRRLLRRLPGAVRRSTSSSARARRVALIGANGAGKSTLLKQRSPGLLPARAATRSGFDGQADRRPARRPRSSRLGIAMVPEGRRLFPSLSVEENLLIGGHAAGRGRWTLERGLRAVPDPGRAPAAAPRTALSGGQQQMVAIGRALMANPDAPALRRDQRSASRRSSSRTSTRRCRRSSPTAARPC